MNLTRVIECLAELDKPEQMAIAAFLTVDDMRKLRNSLSTAASNEAGNFLLGVTLYQPAGMRKSVILFADGHTEELTL